jgi:hypothetical protein
LVWAFLQQVILQDLLLLRLLRLLPTRQAAVGMAALIFASTHLPNPALTVLTLIWGLLACMLFLRYRGLFVLGLAHGLLGLCVAAAIPDNVNHHMLVGRGYLTYGQPKDFTGERRTSVLSYLLLEGTQPPGSAKGPAREVLLS